MLRSPDVYEVFATLRVGEKSESVENSSRVSESHVPHTVTDRSIR